MVDKKIIAIAVVAVVAIASLGGALVLLEDSEKVYNDVPPTDSKLLLYGNANGDDTINDDDVRITQYVLDGKENYTLELYPLADANHNGKIDQDDVDIVTKLKNRESTECYVIAQMDDDDDQSYSVVKVSYPLKHVVSINAEVTSVLVQLGVKNSVAGFQASQYSEYDLKPLIDAGAKALDLSSNRTIKATSYTEIIDLDTKYAADGGVGAIFIYNTNALGDYKSDFATAGIPVIHTKCTNPQDSLTGFRTFGFLFGTDGEEQGRQIANYTSNVMETVSKKLADNGITGDKLTNVLVLFSKSSIADENSQYTYATQEAGGNVINHESGASAKLSNAESILTFNNPAPDVIVSFTTLGMKKCTDEYVVGTVWDFAKLSYLTSSPAYSTLTYVNASMSVSARIAYVAEILYPSLFSGYGAEVWQNYVDSFLPFLNDCMGDKDYDVTKDCTTIITYADYKAAGGKN